MSRFEIAALVVSAVVASGVVWAPAVCLLRRALRRRAHRAGRVEVSFFDVIGRADPGFRRDDGDQPTDRSTPSRIHPRR